VSPAAAGIRHDLVLSSFGASGHELVAAAQQAEQAGFHGIWTYDHITGAMLGSGYSRDCFAVLGAIAATTERVTIGPLVANMMNRHPAQLTVAMATLQSLSNGRAVLGIGAGAAPGSLFAGEHEAIGTPLLGADARRRRLGETIRLFRTLWATNGQINHEGEFFTVSPLGDLVADEAIPPIIVGASGPALAEFSLRYADGVNLLPTPQLSSTLDSIAEQTTAGATDAGFDVSTYDNFDPDHPLGGPLPTHPIVTRRTLALKAPFPLHSIRRVGRELGLTP